jgi:capsular exopolysaccharide synthesis family protein
VNEESRLQFERYLQLVNRRKFVLAIPIVLAVVGAALLSYTTDPVYRSTATARVNINESGIDLSDDGAAGRFLNTFSDIISRTPFLDRVIEDLGLDTDAGSLAGRVSAEPVPNTELIEVTADADDGEEAAAIANEIVTLLRDSAFISQFLTDSVQILSTQVQQTRETLEDEQAKLANLEATNASESQIASQQAAVDATRGAYESLLTQLQEARIRQGQAARAFSLWEPAQPSDIPISPRWRFNLAAGFVVGLAAGVALSLVLEYIDPTLRGVRDLEGVRLPVLASIPFGVRWKYPPPPVSPDYRLLATKLQTTLQDQQKRSVLFTSTRSDEGNTTVATYAAMAMAQAGLRVLLLDANLSNPELHRLFNLSLAPGLYNFISTNGARPHAPLAEAAPQVIQSSPVPRLSVLTAGTKMNDPSEILASAEMRQFLNYLEAEWDVVVIDGSAMSLGAGSAVIAPVVDGVVLVAAEGQASSTSVEDTVAELNSLGANTLGLVFCKATEA